ncbi:hypothetical protein HYY73_02905 [Candidatus Woesearchaeota archaeon]|nr:hypothetical protein [Candidatus Woesearchaeota archaeon]
MVLLGEQFSESDLETLANMGVTTDRSGRLRIGHAVAKEMGLGGGRWLKREEEAKVPAAVKGYKALPAGLISEGSPYNTIERFHLAAAAGVHGVKDLSEDYAKTQAGLEERLEAAKPKHASDGLPQRSVLAAYWQLNQEQTEKGYAPLTPRQFIEWSVDFVGQYLKDAELVVKRFIEKSKAGLMDDPEGALELAVLASYNVAMVAAVMPKLEAARKASAVSGNGSYGAAQVPGADARA